MVWTYRDISLGEEADIERDGLWTALADLVGVLTWDCLFKKTSCSILITDGHCRKGVSAQERLRKGQCPHSEFAGDVNFDA